MDKPLNLSNANFVWKKGNKNDDYKASLSGKIDKYFTFAYSEKKVAKGKTVRTASCDLVQSKMSSISWERTGDLSDWR